MEHLTPAQRAKVLPRFQAKFIPEPNSGCWLWTANADCKGYGRIFINGKYRGAHRVAWMLLRGPIPRGLFVLHKCDVPCCVNPAHLYPGTNSQNMQDAVRRGQLKPQPPHHQGRWWGTSPRRGKFRAYTYTGSGAERRQVYLGTFDDREEAHRAVLRAESAHPTA